MAFRRLVSLLKHWFGSCQSPVATRRPKAFVMALCCADLLAVQIQEGNTDDALLLSACLPGSSQEAAFPSRLPEAFQTFSSLRESFPEVSGYCYCADSLGRELADTGKYPPASDPLT